MELSVEVLESLKLLGSSDPNHFKTVVKEAFADVSDYCTGNVQHKVCCSSGGCYSGLVVLLAELTKRMVSSDQLETLLHELSWPKEHTELMLSQYLRHLPTIRMNLVSIATLLPHVIDIDWKLQQTVSGAPLPPPEEALYVLRLTVRRGSALEDVSLQCSLPQLVSLTDSLRQAGAAMAKLAAATS